MLQLKRCLYAFHYDHEIWSIFLLAYPQKLMGSLMTAIKVWPFEDGQVGSMYYIMRQPSLNRVRDCCKITHPLNQRVELARGSLQGEEKKMWASRLCMALSVNELNNCMKANEQFDSCNSTLVPLSIQLTLRPRFPRASNKKLFCVVLSHHPGKKTKYMLIGVVTPTYTFAHPKGHMVQEQCCYFASENCLVLKESD